MNRCQFSVSLKGATIAFDGRELTADSAQMRRRWQLTDRGLVTTGLRREVSQYEWAGSKPDCDEADWYLRGVTDISDPELIEAKGECIEGETNVNDHLLARFVFRYSKPQFYITWEVRVWPDIPGVWTRLGIKPVMPFDSEKDRERLTKYLGWAYCDRLPVNTTDTEGHAYGLYSNTQHRNFDHLPLLKSRAVPVSEDRPPVSVDWANMITLSRKGEALSVVKESPKCVNTRHVDTGEFVLHTDGLYVTGLGISPDEYGSSPYWQFDKGLTCWASWTILHSADESHRQLAVKRFDRARYPFLPERDGMVMSNTWGSGGAWWSDGSEGSPAATNKSRLLREIESCGDLGIDVLQIDNGWFYPPITSREERHKGSWEPHPERLPGGWFPIRSAADEAGIGLGLWFPYHVAKNNPEIIADNVCKGNFRRLKLDFMGLKTVDDVAEFREAVPELLRHIDDPDTGINWDVTEGIPRVGYFFARQWGNLFLSNRENGPGPMKHGSHIEYAPRLALRDTWQLAHVMNLNQMQITIQDKDATPRDYSNAYLYPHSYGLAIALMGIPLFFQETQFLSDEARAELKPVLEKYKEHRLSMWNGYTFPIGKIPDDHSWTGFQSIDENLEEGYIIVFREIYAEENNKKMQLHFLREEKLKIENVLSEDEHTAEVDKNGFFSFHIEEPGSYLWLRYQKE